MDSKCKHSATHVVNELSWMYLAAGEGDEHCLVGELLELVIPGMKTVSHVEVKVAVEMC